MRKSRFYLIPVICAMLAMLSCGDDKSSNTVDEETFQEIRELVQGDIENILGLTIQGLGNLDGLDTLFFEDIGDIYNKPRADLNSFDSYYVNYHYQDGWHVIELGADSSEVTQGGYSTIQIELVDSIQFKNNSQIVVTPDESTDFLDFRLRAQAGFEGSDGEYYMEFDITDYYLSNQYQLLESGDVQVDGHMQFDYTMELEDQEENAFIELEYDMTINSLLLEEGTGCPSAGTIQAEIELEVQSGNDFESASIDVTITITSPNSMSIYFKLNNQDWNGTESFSCGDLDYSPFKIPSIPNLK